MTQAVVFWCGPVSLQQLGNAILSGVATYSLACLGDRPPSCEALADSFLDAEGRRLPRLLKAYRLAPDTKVALGAFSAGGSVVRRLLMHPSDRQQVVAVHLADALWTAAWEDRPQRVPVSIPAIAKYGAEALADPTKMLVATSSPNPNKGWATGVENLRRLRRDIGMATGTVMAKATLSLSPAPASAHRRGGVTLAAYPAKPLGHGHHVLAPQVWQKWIGPHLMNTPLPPAPLGGQLTGIGQLVGLVGGALLAVTLHRASRR